MCPNFFGTDFRDQELTWQHSLHDAISQICTRQALDQFCCQGCFIRGAFKVNKSIPSKYKNLEKNWQALSDSAAADLDFFCTLFSHDDFFIKYQKFWSFLTI